MAPVTHHKWEIQHLPNSMCLPELQDHACVHLEKLTHLLHSLPSLVAHSKTTCQMCMQQVHFVKVLLSDLDSEQQHHQAQMLKDVNSPLLLETYQSIWQVLDYSGSPEGLYLNQVV